MTRTPEQLLVLLNFIRSREDKTLKIAFEQLEMHIEEDTCNILNSLGIDSSVKNLRKTLPYQCEIKGSKGFNSFINYSFDVKFLQRKLIKKLLDDPVFKIRMYCDIETIMNNNGNIEELEYRIRYYRH